MATAPTGNAMPCPERISVRFYPSAHLPTQTKPPEQVLPVPDAWYSVLLLPYRQTDAPAQTALQNSTVLRPAWRFAAAPLEPYAAPHQISAAHVPSSQLPGSAAAAYDSPDTHLHAASH